MKTLSLVGLVLSAVLTAPALAAEPAYKIVDRIKVPDGGFDYATFDAARSRILMARGDFTTVIDTKTGKVSQLNSGALGHMALPIPGTTLIVLPQRRGTIRIADTATDMVLAELPGGKNPDGATYDPVTKYVFVKPTCFSRSRLLVVEPHSRSIVPLAISGIRVADVTGLSATFRFGMLSLALTASTTFMQMSIA